MDATRARNAISQNGELRRWISRAFIVSILVYFVVLGYLIAEAVTGASKWAPYGVNISIFVTLIIASELVMVLTAIRIFREDSGIWPPTISEGWAAVRSGSVIQGLKQMLAGAWDISLIDLRLRATSAIFMGRTNRVAALVPLVYALAASAGGAPWGLRGSALFDIGLTMVVWAFMELVMVRPGEQVSTAPAAGLSEMRSAIARGAEAAQNGAKSTSIPKQSRYIVRKVELSDLDRIEEIERAKWKDQAATREIIERRINTYPEGQIAAVHVTEANGVPVRSKVAAWCTVMLANEAQVRSFTSWDEVTSNGTISGCDRDGDVVVGVNLTSVTEGATYILLAEILAAVVGGGKAKFIGGSRLNGFVAFNERRRSEGKQPHSADAYARLREIRSFRINELRRDEGLEPLPDDEYRVVADCIRRERGASPLTDEDTPDYVCSNLRGYMSIPGARMVDVVPNYFRDPASADYGVVLEWANPIPRPIRHIPAVRNFVVRKIRQEIMAEWERRKLRLLAKRRAMERAPEYLRKRRGEDASVEEPSTHTQATASERNASEPTSVPPR